MSYSEIIKETDSLRVSIEVDEYASEPWGDCYAPTFRFETGVGATALVFGNADPSGADDRIVEALNRWGDPSSPGFARLFEKWARAYLGTTKVDTWYSDGLRGWYVALDTAAWRETVGAPSPLTEDMLHDVRAWAEGDVFVVTAEQRVHVKYRKDKYLPEADQSFESEASEYDEWEHVDSCGGFYGWDSAREGAAEMFDQYSEEKNAV